MEQLGAHVQAARVERAITRETLAERCGLSILMLTEIEAGNVNPTVATVWKIAQGLGIDVHTLTSGDPDAVRIFHTRRHDDVTVVDTDQPGVHITVLTPMEMVEDLEMYLVILQPEGVLGSGAHFPGTEEYLTVLDGSVRVHVGNRIEQLHDGDFIRYQCDVPHRIEAHGERPARVHMVVRFRRRGIGF